MYNHVKQFSFYKRLTAIYYLFYFFQMIALSKNIFLIDDNLLFTFPNIQCVEILLTQKFVIEIYDILLCTLLVQKIEIVTYDTFSYQVTP